MFTPQEKTKHVGHVTTSRGVGGNIANTFWDNQARGEDLRLLQASGDYTESCCGCFFSAAVSCKLLKWFRKVSRCVFERCQGDVLKMCGIFYMSEKKSVLYALDATNQKKKIWDN